MTNNKERWEQELQVGLDRMDEWVAPKVIDLQQWEKRIVEERRVQRKRLMRELTIFWVIAAVVLILGLVSFTQLPTVFITIQVVALIGFPIYWVFKIREKVTIQ